MRRRQKLSATQTASRLLAHPAAKYSFLSARTPRLARIRAGSECTAHGVTANERLAGGMFIIRYGCRDDDDD
jgi:hypothetical protein